MAKGSERSKNYKGSYRQQRAQKENKVGKPKKMRKSSLSQAQKNFEVFSNNDYENKYAMLDDVAFEDDENERVDDIKVIEIESDSESSSATPGASTNQELANNDDFIAFDDSSEEEAEPFDYDNFDNGYHEPNTGQPILNTDYPWILDHDHSKQREISDWLTLEIKDFIAYISPSKAEIEVRNETIRRLRSAIVKFWPDSEMHVFGSFATDLYLPGSDIDIVVVSSSGDKDQRQNLYDLASYLKSKKLAIRVEVIAKARVPIIKFVDPSSDIHIDVSFERTNGIEAAKVIRSWMSECPGLRELVLIVKQFLAARRLNNVHTGGLGGYSIICLVYSFLKMHPRLICGSMDAMDNLGVLLIDFFELYGRNFGYDDVAICVDDGNLCYLNKRYHPDLRTKNPFALAIQDPSDRSNNISRGSFNIREIKKAFSGAFDLLTNRCFELDSATFKHRIGASILGNVIKYRGKERDFKDERDLVVNTAIVENENHVAKVEVYTDESMDEDIVIPTKKKKRLETKKQHEESRNPKKQKKSKKTVDDYMGLSDEDKVDTQTRREYWSKKGNSL